MHILLVDDNELSRRALHRALSVRSHQLEGASDGSDALARMDEVRADLVICDVWMPGMHGLSFLRASRRRYPAVPVVPMTGNRTVDAALAASNGGAPHCLRKPFDALKLLQWIRGARGGRPKGSTGDPDTS